MAKEASASCAIDAQRLAVLCFNKKLIPERFTD